MDNPYTGGMHRELLRNAADMGMRKDLKTLVNSVTRLVTSIDSLGNCLNNLENSLTARISQLQDGQELLKESLGSVKVITKAVSVSDFLSSSFNETEP